MKFNHVHLSVRNLPRTLSWFKRVLGAKPSFQYTDMAVLSVKGVCIVLDKASRDTVATLAFEAPDCDKDVRELERKGARVKQSPQDRSYGVRSAFLKGPGALTFEINGPLKKKGA